MIRPRKVGYRDLPINLYYDKHQKVYKYIHPQTKKAYIMGKNKNEAIEAANQLNSMLLKSNDLVGKVLGVSGTLSDFIDNRFIPIILPERKLSDVTIKKYHQQIKNIKNDIGKISFESLNVKIVADYLNKFNAVSSNRYRSLLSLIFQYAVAEGLLSDNYAEKTIKRSEEKQRKRLTEEAFDAIYKIACDMAINEDKKEPYLKNAIDIAVITLQRINDIVNMKFEDIKDGYLYVIQNKTKKHGDHAYIKIYIGHTLNEVIMQCRDNTISPYLIHRLSERPVKSKIRKHHTQISTSYLTRAFSKARDETKLFDDTPRRERPTFHELRALGIQRYEAKGINPDTLTGHMTEEMKKHYRKGFEPKWTEAVSF